MAKTDDRDILLSSLEEIKKSSAEEPAPAPVAAAPVRPAKPKSTVTSGLLGSLLDEVKAEADREIMEITRNLEEKTAQVRKDKKDEELKKKEQYDKLIQEEARRRMGMIQKKEDEKRRKQEEIERKEALRKQTAIAQVKQKKQRKVLLAVTSVVGVALVVVVALVATGVIPLGDKPVATEQATQEDSHQVADNKEQPRPRPGASDYKGPPIGDFEDTPIGSFEGPATKVLAVPEKTPLDRFSFPGETYPQPEETVASDDQMRKKIAKAFAGRSGSSGSSGSTDSSGITIDTSVFKD